MSDGEFKSGDRVINLAAFTRGAAAFAGSVAGGLTAWLTVKSLSSSAAGLGGGGVAGYIVGFGVARLLFPAPRGEVVVTRVGHESLPLTLKGGLLGAVTSSTLISVSCAFLLGSPVTSALSISLAAGALIGVSFACLSSLT